MNSRLQFLILLIFGLTSVTISFLAASQYETFGIQYRIYPALAFFIATFGITRFALHRARSVLWTVTLTMIVASSLTCSLLQHELVLLFYPSLFCIPAFLWACLGAPHAETIRVSC